jgi:hypothetical protein
VPNDGQRERRSGDRGPRQRPATARRCFRHEHEGSGELRPILAALAHAANQHPDRATRLRIEAGGQLVEKYDFGIVDEGERDEQPLPLSARQGHEPCVPLFGQAQMLQEPIAIDRPLVQRSPQIDGFPDLDPLLQLRGLQLHADAMLQRAPISQFAATRQICGRRVARSPILGDLSDAKPVIYA